MYNFFHGAYTVRLAWRSLATRRQLASLLVADTKHFHNDTLSFM